MIPWGRKLAFARALRRRATVAERRAWELLRNRKTLGLKFRRQRVIRGFIVDFYCAEWRLVLEIDGPIHTTPSQRAYDRERDSNLTALGLTIIRLPNSHVHPLKLQEILTKALRMNTRVPPLPPAGEGDRG